MVRFLAIATVVFVAGNLGACAQLAGLSDYAAGNLAEGGRTGSDAAQPEDDATTPADATASADAANATDAIESTDGAEGPDGAADTGAGADGANEGRVSVVSGYACAKGGCNGAGGACSTATTCVCVNDSQCASGLCAVVTGQNDVSCGSNCTTTAAAHDGFDCVRASPGIPASPAATFRFAPSNFTASNYTAPATDTTDCNATYNSTSHTFITGSCAGAAPTIYGAVSGANPTGPSADILAFKDLTIASGSTLTLVGNDPVILAVYGTATIAGSIIADGAAGATSGSATAASGPGGNFNCGPSSGMGPANGVTTNAGAGGGGASANGGNGGNDSSGSGGAHNGYPAGLLRANAALLPLYGGCPGGNGWCGALNTGGGGGGAVQISAAAGLAVTGTISAQGGAGGSGPTGQTTCVSSPAGGGGGGGGGAILLEGPATIASSASMTNVNGGAGGGEGAKAGGAGGTSTAQNGGPGVTDNTAKGGSGGGGSYGYLVVNAGKTAPSYTCSTSLTPAPVPNATTAPTACLCVADGDCPSGHCSNANGLCTATCSGGMSAGSHDAANCAVLESTPSAWSCPQGSCNDVTSPGAACGGAGVPCWCASDAQCGGSRCVTWAGCPSGMCTGSGTPDGFHCAP